MGRQQDFSDGEFARELEDLVESMARDNDALDELQIQASKGRYKNNLFDQMIEDAKALYLIYLDAEECAKYSEKRVFQVACEACVQYSAALIADDDDRIYRSLTSTEAASVERILKLGRVIREYADSDGGRRSRRDDRDSRGGRGRDRDRDRGRGRDRDDDREYERGNRNSRDSRRGGRERSRVHGSNVGRSNNVGRHLDNIENATAVQSETTNTGNDNVKTARTQREPDAPATNVGERKYLPLLDIYPQPFEPSSKKPWPTIFHADTQLPLYLAKDNGTSQPEILEDVVLSLTDTEALKLKTNPIPDHQTHLLFRRRNPQGYKGDSSNMTEMETRLKQAKDESLAQVYDLLELEGDVFKAKDGAKLPAIFNRRMVIVPDVINASGFKDKVWAMIDFMDQRIRAIDPATSCEDMLAMATIEIDADSVLSFDTEENLDSFEEMLQAMRKTTSYAAFAKCLVELADVIPRRIWNVINDDLTAYILEILEVEFALENPSVDSFARSVDALIGALDHEYGRSVSEHFADTHTKLLANCMQFARIPDTLAYRLYRHETVVMLPLVAEDVDYALALNSGIGMVSQQLMPGLHAGLTRVLTYGAKNKSRRINLVTLDGASVSVHSSPLTKDCVLLSNRSWT